MEGMPVCDAWDTIKRELGEKGQRIVMQGQTIAYQRSVIQMNECKFCLAAYAAALRSHTSTVLRGQLKTQVRCTSLFGLRIESNALSLKALAGSNLDLHVHSPFVCMQIDSSQHQRSGSLKS